MNSDIIKDFSSRKLVDQIRPGQRVLIQFDWHGMGDCIMFMPLYKRLKELYDRVEFSLQCGKGQEYFNDNIRSGVTYDRIFNITFPEPSARFPPGWSKPEVCCNTELGIEFDRRLDFTWEPASTPSTGIKLPDNAVGMAFQCTSGPKKNVPENVASMLWQAVKDLGFTPVEICFEHVNHHSANAKFPFIDCTCRNFTPSIEACIDAISQCRTFIGLNTGTLCMACCMRGGDVGHLFTRYPFIPLYKKFGSLPLELDCRAPELVDLGKLEQYLKGLKS